MYCHRLIHLPLLRSPLIGLPISTVLVVVSDLLSSVYYQSHILFKIGAHQSDFAVYLKKKKKKRGGGLNV